MAAYHAQTSLLSRKKARQKPQRSCCMTHLKYILLISCLFLVSCIHAQKTDIPLGALQYDLWNKSEILSGQMSFSTFKPFERRLPTSRQEVGINPFAQKYLRLENRELHTDSLVGQTKKSLFNRFFQYESDLVSVKNKDFDLHVNPQLHFALGRDASLSENLFINTRGLEIRGTIDNKVAFYTSLQENQMRLPGYVQAVQDTVGLIPYEGFWKGYNEDAYDFLRAEGYVDFGFTKHISAQFGFGRHFIGNGERSLILSDFSNRYPYLRMSTEIWKFKYTNLFAELIGDVFFFDGGTLGSRNYPKKYLSLHHLDFAITDNLHIGLFESVMNGSPDSLGGSGLEVQYLNPIIFYGALEQQDGSADNVIVGMDFSWNIRKKAQLYGQFVLDELVVSELRSGDGWWGNKYGFQLGLKYINFFTQDLDWQLEYNQARPFTYGHDRPFTNYTHYRQPLAHPLGANFRELLALVKYQPIDRLFLESTFLFTEYGSGPVGGFSIGRDPLINTNNRGIALENDFGHEIGQGIPTILFLGSLTTSYMWKHNLFIDVQLIYRDETRDGETDSQTIFSTGVRWNLPLRTYQF